MNTLANASAQKLARAAQRFLRALYICTAIIFGGAAADAFADKTATPSKSESSKPAAPLKSVFVDSPQVGRDPFFPVSTRRLDALPRIVSTPATNAPPPSASFDLLRLKGISGTKGQPLALINSTTVGVGEIAEIKCIGRQVVKVKLLAIRDSSVLVELSGVREVRELKLREGI